MLSIRFPNDVPWLPDCAVLGSTEAKVIFINALYETTKLRQLASPGNKDLLDERIYYAKLKLATKVTTQIIETMIASSKQSKAD